MTYSHSDLGQGGGLLEGNHQSPPPKKKKKKERKTGFQRGLQAIDVLD